MKANDKKNKFMIRTAVGIVIFIILILWAVNLKNVWEYNQEQDTPSSAQWVSLKSNLEKSLDEAKNRLDQIKDNKAEQEKQAGANFLTGLLKNVDNRASSSAAIATSSAMTATSSNEISAVGPSSATSSDSLNCPAYIDCMPSVGDAKDCTVPAGCEDITLIAY